MSERDVSERTDRTEYDTNPGERGKWTSALIALAGVWMIVEPFVFDVVQSNLLNDVVVGVVLVALGGFNFYRRADEKVGYAAVAAAAALVGLWLIASPFVYGRTVPTGVAPELGFWNDVVVGLLVAASGAYSAYEARETTSDSDRRATA
ncbi:SPW repeat protein [Halopelagius longus]|uniref:SPW repeat-containing protein n=1 Tax=Halopelagius longus TaxID=1236180 RepID=A0A1H1EXF8_9EURY|nr:SPW repeat protein [Halopelagius longus]RDI71930.1 hypothetical protein DWB78_09455 [Halopelagius longus]SDQ93338.1 SPW repeat-containing protein [Halopelagius longus]